MTSTTTLRQSKLSVVLMILIGAVVKRYSSALFAKPVAKVHFMNEWRMNADAKQPVSTRAMHIQSIPMCEFLNAGLQECACINLFLGEGTGNNYAYLVSDDKTKEAVIIDPANPPE